MIFNGTIQIGGDLEAFRAFAHFGRLSPSTKYGMLHGALQACLDESTDIAEDEINAVAYQAETFLEEFNDQLSEHEKWIIQQLAGMNN